MIIPRSIDDISREWLSDLLQKKSQIPDDVTVESIIEVEIDKDLSYVSSIKKLKLLFSDHEIDPLVIIIKLSSTNSELLNSVKFSKLYERERVFYTKIQKRLDLLTPHCLWISLDEKSYQQLIIMIAQEEREVYTREVGCPPEKVPSVLKAMAHLHAHFWNNLEYEWLEEIPEYFELYDIESVMRDFHLVLDEFQKKIGRELPDQFSILKSTPWQEMVKIIDHIYNKRPRTLVHGDCKLDNMFFISKGGQSNLMLMDWQLMEKGNPVIDLAYFLVENLTIENRRELEESYIHLYYRYLLEEGVKDYSYEELYQDYKLYLIHRFGLIIYEISRIHFSSKIIEFEINVLLPRIIDAMVAHRVWEYQLP